MNTDFEKSVDTFTELMLEKGIAADTAMIKDFGIKGGELDSQLQEWVNDYVSDLHTERCEAEAEKKGEGIYSQY